MRICVLVWFVLVALVLFSGCVEQPIPSDVQAFDGVVGYDFYIGDCSCSTCDECELELNTACTYVNLTADIVNYTGTCINNPTNFTGKIFDGQGYTIDGDDTGSDYGVYLSGNGNNTIKNCIITDYERGIYLYSSSNNNTLTNNTANLNSWGIYLTSSSNNTLTNNTANLNTYGIYLNSSSNNTVTNNTVNSNTYGIFLMDADQNNLIENTVRYNNRTGVYILATSTSNTINNNMMCDNNQDTGAYYDISDLDTNTGDNNTCTVYDNWNDTGVASGCDNFCSCVYCNEINDTVVIGTVYTYTICNVSGYTCPRCNIYDAKRLSENTTLCTITVNATSTHLQGEYIPGMVPNQYLYLGIRLSAILLLLWGTRRICCW